jgi:integrase
MFNANTFRKDKILDNDEILPENKKLILDFDDENAINNIKDSTRLGYLIILRQLGEFTKTPFKELKKEDVKKFLTMLKKGYKSKRKSGMYHETSITIYKGKIKKFFQWVYQLQRHYYPECVNWLITSMKSNNTKLPKDLLTEEEIEKMVNISTHSRDKAITSILYESALRMGEFRSLKIKDFIFDNYGAKIQVSGKTGDRLVRIVKSTPYLKQWLNEHPKKDNDAFVWINISKHQQAKFLELMTKNGIRTLLQRQARLSNVNKKIYPHLLRHSRLTVLANKLTEAQLREFAGWEKDSMMAERYVHLSSRDIDDAVLKAEGRIKVKEETTKPKTVFCYKCKTENPKENKYCYNCYNPLDIAEVKKVEAMKEIIKDYIYEKMIIDPEFNEKRRKLEQAS